MIDEDIYKDVKRTCVTGYSLSMAIVNLEAYQKGDFSPNHKSIARAMQQDFKSGKVFRIDQFKY